ncbi:MAG: apolipoprotein N-acyltransferase, partial [Cyanobacteria bacterium P01_A01_bin.68]
MKSNIFIKLITRNSKQIIALASGITMGLTVAPVGAWFLAWFAMIPLWLIVINSSKYPKQKNKSLPPSLLWALGYHGTALYWITGLHPLTWLGVPWLGSIAIASFAWFFISFWGGILVMLWARLIKVFSTQNAIIKVLLGTAIWCALERVWSAGPLWWSSLSYTQSPHNLVILHLGQISGPTAVTAVIVAVNGFLAEALNAVFLRRLNVFSSGYQGEGYDSDKSDILQASQRFEKIAIAVPGILAIAIFISAHLIGYSLYSRPLSQPAEAALKVGIVQGNIPNRLKFKPEGKQR